MIGQGYTIYESSQSLQVTWASPALPPGIRWAVLASLVLLPLLFLARKRAARFAARHMHLAELTSARIAILAPVLSLAAAVLLYVAGRPRDLVRWDLGPTELRVKSLNGEVVVPWKDVTAVRRDDRDPDPEDAALIIEAGDKKTWLVMSWLRPPHQGKVLERINRQAPGKSKT